MKGGIAFVKQLVETIIMLTIVLQDIQTPLLCLLESASPTETLGSLGESFISKLIHPNAPG